MSETIDITPSPADYARSQAIVLLSWADKCSLSGEDFNTLTTQVRANDSWTAFFDAVQALQVAGVEPTPALKRKIANATLTKFFRLV